jgi:hypothetical protein
MDRMQPGKQLALLLLIILIVLFIWGIHRRGYFLPGRVSVAVDTKIVPSIRTVSGFDKDPPRPVAALNNGRGTKIDFVENELIYTSDDAAAAEAFAKRCGGTVVRHIIARDSGISAPGQHLVRINAKNGDLKQLVADLKKMNPGRSGKLNFSSDAGLALVAIASHEAAAGNPIGINFILPSTGYSDRNLTEGMPPVGGPGFPVLGSETFTRNPNGWSYFVRGDNTQNIGVGDAWRVLDQVGRLKVRVKIAVVDGGFLTNDDNPSNFEIDTNSIWAQDHNHKNDLSCSNGLVCDWHGTNVVGTLMGVPNNNYGAAGPAGPVATALAIRSSGDVFNYLGTFVKARWSNSRIVNMSFGGGVPFLLSWAALPIDAMTILMHDTGQLLVASSGNDGLDVDAEDCAWPFDWPCWERVWYVPCENGGVMCVGALSQNSKQKLASSNYGSHDVDIFGPGAVWVGPDLQYQDVHGFYATSAASPFVAGVAALVVAANPSLTNNDIEKILIDTANPSPDGNVRRYVNAYAAVIKALGGTPPDITIAVDVASVFGACQTLYNFSATVADPDDGPPTVQWTSSIDGPLGTGTSFSRQLSPGTHLITATATDRIGLSTTSNQVTLTAGPAAAGPRPTLTILSLTNHQTFAANQNITLEAGGDDPNKALGGLVSSNVHWSSSKDGELGAGQRLFKHLNVGSHFIVARYTGICGGTADDLRLITVTDAVADAPPNMYITTPSGNDIVQRVDPGSGEACLHVAGFGFDEEDQDFASIDFWETNRSDLQIKALSFDQNTTVCLKAVPGAPSTVHQIRLRGFDKKGHLGISAPLQVTVLPSIH